MENSIHQHKPGIRTEWKSILYFVIIIFPCDLYILITLIVCVETCLKGITINGNFDHIRGHGHNEGSVNISNDVFGLVSGHSALLFR